MLKFSCLCVTYGRPQYIGEAVQCFLQQTYENKELVILNTCPRQEYHIDHPLIKVVNLKERPINHCTAMHMGVLETSGDWIVPWDDDDIWMPGFISQYADFIETDPESGWVQLHGRYFGTLDRIVDYKPTESYAHLFTISRKLYDEVGGYITPSEAYNDDICDRNLGWAMRHHKGMDVYNKSHNNSMIYRFVGVSYHHSSAKVKGRKNYDVCYDVVNKMLDLGEIPEGRIEIIPSAKYDWEKMTKEVFVPFEYVAIPKIPQPCNVLESIKHTAWRQFIRPLIRGDRHERGEFVCVKTFEDGRTRDGFPYTVTDDGIIEFDGHRLEYDNYGQLVGRHEGYNVGLRYEKVPYSVFPKKYGTVASKINLYVQTYKATTDVRQKELDDCLRLNKALPFLNVIEYPKEDRMTFKEMMDFIRPFSNDDTISIFANSDMVFDESIKSTLYMSPEESYWLTRYENASVNEDGSLNIEKVRRNKNEGSSDAWVFRGVLKEVKDIDFGFGIWACDTAFAARLKASGYGVLNPCLSIKTYHVHDSDIRTNQFPQVDGPWDRVIHCHLPWYHTEDYDFISAHAFRDKCEIELNQEGFKYNKFGVKNTVFVHTDKLNTFFETYPPSEPFILISNNSDTPVNQALAHHADNPLLIKWYAQNLDFNHPKVKGCPIGLINDANANDIRICGNKELLLKVMNEENEKKFLINTMMEPHYGRKEVLKKCGLKLQPKEAFEDYLRNVSESYFCLSPNGNGIDCHRTWESLYLKTIPIVIKNAMVDVGMYKGLPIIFVDSWDDYKKLKLNEDTYRKIWGNFNPKTLTCDRFIPELGGNVKKVSFSLYGNDRIYIDNAFRNVVDYKTKLGNDWKVHITFGDDVNEADRDNLISQIDSYEILPASQDTRGMLWRGLVEADILLIRDIDAILSDREVESIKTWLESPYSFCTFRDHHGHRNKILGGLLSIKGRNNVDRINALYKEALDDAPHGFYYGYDEDFLAARVYPVIKSDCVEFTSQGTGIEFAKHIALPPRLSPFDVIGDGIGKYAPVNGAINSKYPKIINDNVTRLMKIGKLWTSEITAKAWVSFGSIEDAYNDFYEPVSKMWNRFGYKTFYTLICDESSIEKTPYGVILRLKKAESNHTYDTVFHRNYCWQAQISRLYAASYISGIMMTSDLDSMPLQAEYYDKLLTIAKKDNTIAVSRKVPYTTTDKYCMMWTAANANIFETVFGSKKSFDEFCDTYTKTFEMSFTSDERFLTDAINESGKIIKYMDNVPIVRIDKTYWHYDKIKLANGGYTDSHLLRPYKDHETSILNLMKERFANEPSSITKYGKDGKNTWAKNWGSKTFEELKEIHQSIKTVDDYSYKCGTHIDLINDVLDLSNSKTVIEFGGGYWSTALFLNKCESVITVEQGQNVANHENEKWATMLGNMYSGSNWKYIKSLGVTDWTNLKLDTPDVVFVDGNPQARKNVLQHFINQECKFIIAHDTEHDGFLWSHVNTKGYIRVNCVKYPENKTSVWTRDKRFVRRLLALEGYERSL